MFSGFGTRPKSQALPVIQRAQVGRRANNAETLTRELNYGNRQSRVGRSLGFDQREARICEFDVHRRPAYQLIARSQHRDLTEVVQFDASDISVYGRGDATYCHWGNLPRLDGGIESWHTSRSAIQLEEPG